MQPGIEDCEDKTDRIRTVGDKEIRKDRMGRGRPILIADAGNRDRNLGTSAMDAGDHHTGIRTGGDGIAAVLLPERPDGSIKKRGIRDAALGQQEKGKKNRRIMNHG